MPDYTAGDFTTDQNPDLFMWMNSRGLVPDYVLDSGMLEPSDFEKLASAAFADPEHRLYPCNTKEACWMSAVHYMGRGGEDPRVLGVIEKMADWHGIREDVDKAVAALAEEASMEKGASADDAGERSYALVLEGEDGSETGYYPVNSAVEIIDSSERAADDYRSRALPLPQFRKVAAVICDAAEEAGVGMEPLAGDVVRHGVRRLPDPYSGQVVIAMRKSAGIDTTPYEMLLGALREGLEKAASTALCIDVANDVAGRMFAIDNAYGLNYGPRMVDPFTAIFCGPPEEDLEKFASSVVQVDDVHVPVVDFLNLSDDRIDATFSKAAALSVKEAKASLSGAGAQSAEDCAAASDKIASMSPEARKVLLATLAGVAW